MRDLAARVPYLPHDELAGASPDMELAADISELAAYFAEDQEFLLSDLRNDLEIGGDEYTDVDQHNRLSDEVILAASRAIENRNRLLGDAYPFSLSDGGSTVSFIDSQSWARATYLLCLVLSHLKAITPVLSEALLAPDNGSERILRDWFQKVAAPALAAELAGQAWAFGHPRLDEAGFLKKLQDVWAVVGDGRVHTDMPEKAPQQVKDDEVDVIAARPHPDGNPGFPIALAQVATGKNWKSKSIRIAADHRFFKLWFEEHPASQIFAYHIIPFAVDRETICLQTMSLGHILNRVRVVGLVDKAESAIEQGLIKSEGTNVFEPLRNWLDQYRAGGGENAA